MPDTSDSPKQDVVPSEGQPEVGAILYRDTGVAIASVYHWIDEGLHVFRSAEFDLIAAAEDEQEAVNQFVDSLEDRLELIANLDEDEVTEDEAQLFRQVTERFFEAWRILEERERRRVISIRVGSRRKRSRGNWRRRSGRESETSAPASIA